jgi:hypothetical protein
MKISILTSITVFLNVLANFEGAITPIQEDDWVKVTEQN